MYIDIYIYICILTVFVHWDILFKLHCILLIIDINPNPVKILQEFALRFLETLYDSGNCFQITRNIMRFWKLLSDLQKHSVILEAALRCSETLEA